MEPVWVDVLICNAMRPDCRIDAGLLGALGSWGAAIGTLLTLAFVVRANRRDHRELRSEKLKHRAALLLDISHDLQRTSSWAFHVAHAGTASGSAARLAGQLTNVKKLRVARIGARAADLHYLEDDDTRDVQRVMGSVADLRAVATKIEGSLASLSQVQAEAYTSELVEYARAATEAARRVLTKHRLGDYAS